MKRTRLIFRSSFAGFVTDDPFLDASNDYPPSLTPNTSILIDPGMMIANANYLYVSVMIEFNEIVLFNAYKVNLY